MTRRRWRRLGEKPGLNAWETRYRGRVVVLARRMLAGQGADEAEDVVQETFWPPTKNAPVTGWAFRPWLYRIAINRCLDRLRAEARHGAVLNWDAVVEPSAAPDADPPNVLLTDEGERRLEAAVAELPPKLRAVFLLRHLDDLSYEDIGTATGVPTSTVKTHLLRARAFLRAALSEYLQP